MQHSRRNLGDRSAREQPFERAALPFFLPSPEPLGSVRPDTPKGDAIRPFREVLS
jgi:hypothetical protein